MGLETYPDRASWLAARRSVIGSSDAAALLGAFPENAEWARGPLSVYNSKVLGEDVEVTKKMLAGQVFEKAIAEFWALTNDRELHHIPPHSFYAHPLCKFVAASPDVFGWGQGPRLVLEVKRPDPKSEGFSWKQGLPLYYWTQIQHQLLVLDACGEQFDGGLCIADFGGDNVREFEVAPDREFWSLAMHKYQQFWRNHVEAKVPPPPDPARDSLDEIKRRYNKSTEGKRVDLPRELVCRWRDIGEQFKIAEDAKKAIQKEIVVAIGDGEQVYVDGILVATNKMKKAYRVEAYDVDSKPDLRKTKGIDAL
jgi:predicted phage-related endonuclease